MNSKPKILYVEDNDDNVFMMRGRLTRVGFDVIVAVDGEQGVALATSEAPDLILMDLRLPGIDGWEATRRNKASPATKHIPVIALSAHAMAGDRERTLAAGCDDYDTKPVDLPQLLEKICALPDPAVESTTVSTFGKAFIAGVIISVPSVLLQSLCC